jgi:hypothetical protein
MVEKISVAIALEGGDQIEKQLADIGKAGQKAFADISKSAEQVGGFDKLKPDEVTAQLQKMGITGVDAINKIQAAVQQATRLESLVKSIAVVEETFAALANTAKRFIEGFAAASVVGTAALYKFANAGEQTEKALSQLQAVSGKSFENLSAMSIVFAEGGTKVKQFATEFGNLALKVQQASRTMADDVEQSSQRVVAAHQSAAQASLRLTQAELALMQQQHQAIQAQRSGLGSIDVNADQRLANAQINLRLQEAEQRVAQARLAQQQAQHAAHLAEANDLQKIIDLYKQMAAGVQVAFDPLTTQATKNSALFATLAQAGQNYEFVLADILKNASNLERVQIAKVLQLPPETVNTLSLGSEKLREMQAAVQQLGLSFTNLDQTNLAQLRESQTRLGGIWDALKEKMGALAAPAFTSFWQGFTDEIQRLIPAFLQLAQEFGKLDFSRLGATAADFVLVLGKIATGLAAIVTGNVSFKDLFAELFKQLVVLAADAGLAAGKAFVEGMIQGASDLWQRFKTSVFGGGPPAPATAGSGEGMAGGGLIGGRGSGTSDSNLAWVSRGEHVMPARAVAQPGVLAFLEALRRSGGNLSRVLDGMGRFALGGLVPRPIPAFAAGGLVGGMSNVTIQFPGLPPIAGLRASTSTIDELHRAAALAQVRSGGRKPSRYS